MSSQPTTPRQPTQNSPTTLVVIIVTASVLVLVVLVILAVLVMCVAFCCCKRNKQLATADPVYENPDDITSPYAPDKTPGAQTVPLATTSSSAVHYENPDDADKTSGAETAPFAMTSSSAYGVSMNTQKSHGESPRIGDASFHNYYDTIFSLWSVHETQGAP